MFLGKTVQRFGEVESRVGRQKNCSEQFTRQYCILIPIRWATTHKRSQVPI